MEPHRSKVSEPLGGTLPRIPDFLDHYAGQADLVPQGFDVVVLGKCPSRVRLGLDQIILTYPLSEGTVGSGVEPTGVGTLQLHAATLANGVLGLAPPGVGRVSHMLLLHWCISIDVTNHFHTITNGQKPTLSTLLPNFSKFSLCESPRLLMWPTERTTRHPWSHPSHAALESTERCQRNPTPAHPANDPASDLPRETAALGSLLGKGLPDGRLDFLLAAGATPGMCPEYLVNPALPPALSAGQEADRIRQGRRSRNVALLLNVLCLDGYIPAGRYTIDTHPEPPPGQVYRALLIETGDPNHPRPPGLQTGAPAQCPFTQLAAQMDKAVLEAQREQK